MKTIKFTMLIKFKPQEKVSILIRQKNSICNIDIENINFIQCDGDVSTLHFVDRRNNVFVSKRLKHFEEELREYGFVRSIHNILVNLLQIHEIKNGKDRVLILKNNEIVPVSYRKLPKIIGILQERNTNNGIV